MKYWNQKGKYQKLYDVLQPLIPIMDACPPNQPALDKLRRAGNCYYDLYNNGLCNRAAEFRRVFGFGGKVIMDERRYRNQTEIDRLEAKLDAAIDEFVLAAALESVKLGLVTMVSIEIAPLKKDEEEVKVSA